MKLLLEIIGLWLLSLVLPFIVMAIIELVSCREWKTVEYYLGASQFNKAQVIKKTVCISY